MSNFRYVQRDAGGNIIGDFANRQPGIAEELVDLDAPQFQPDPKQVHNDGIDAQIAALEATSQGGVFVRGIREFMLGAATLFKQANGVDMMVTPGMQKVKALDDQIVALRAQRTP